MENDTIYYENRLDEIAHDFRNGYWGIHHHQHEAIKNWDRVNKSLEKLYKFVDELTPARRPCRDLRELPLLPCPGNEVATHTLQVIPNRLEEQSDKDHWVVSFEIYVKLPKFSLKFSFKKWLFALIEKRLFSR